MLDHRAAGTLDRYLLLGLGLQQMQVQRRVVAPGDGRADRQQLVAAA